MHNITLNQIKHKIEEVKKYSLCRDTINQLDSISTVDEFINHKHVYYFVYLICKETQIRWKEIENIFLKIPGYAYLYSINVIK